MLRLQARASYEWSLRADPSIKILVYVDRQQGAEIALPRDLHRLPRVKSSPLQRRGTNWAGAPAAADLAKMNSTTRRGFTFHEHLDSSELIHMNGRVYDPLLGRFVSADPFVPAPLLTQSFNRYSYVYNSALSFTDPSGFDPDGLRRRHRNLDDVDADVQAELERDARMLSVYRAVWENGGSLPSIWGMTGLQWAQRYLLAGFRGADGDVELESAYVKPPPRGRVTVECTVNCTTIDDERPIQSMVDFGIEFAIRLEGSEGAYFEAGYRRRLGQYLRELRDARRAGLPVSMGTTQVTRGEITVVIPAGWTGRVADNGRGLVYQRPGAQGNADSIRIMDPTSRYPSGYLVYYNSFGQPLNALGKPAARGDTHIPLDYVGPLPVWPK